MALSLGVGGKVLRVCRVEPITSILDATIGPIEL